MQGGIINPMSIRECGFIGALLQDHRDWTIMAAYSDWLEEQGRSEQALPYRWMAARQKTPGHRLTHPSGRAVNHNYSWAWYCATKQTWVNVKRPPDAMLPRILFQALPEYAFSKDHCYYPSFAHAVMSLSRALHTLTDVVKC